MIILQKVECSLQEEELEEEEHQCHKDRETVFTDSLQLVEHTHMVMADLLE